MLRRLYRTPVPESALLTQTGTTQAELALLTELQGTGLVQHQGTDAGDLQLNIQYRGQYSDRLQLEARELVESPTIDAMPLAPVDGRSSVDGYYTVEQVSGGPATPKSDQIENVDPTLVKKGTRNSQWQGVTTTITQPEPGHPFGNETTALVGLPAGATHVRAVDAKSEPTTRLTPSPTSTVQGEHGAVELYDADALSIDDPVFYYDLAYDLQGDVDPGVWDTYGADSITDADDVVQWGRVFDQAHDFRGSAVLENGLVRVTISEPSDSSSTGTLEAERWDDGTSSWSAVSLPAEDWAPLDLDLMRIGQARIDAQLEFEATADTTDASTGDTYAVDIVLHRGYDDVQVWIPGSVSDPIPTDLESLLDPIADESVYASGAEQRLIARQEVRL